MPSMWVCGFRRARRLCHRHCARSGINHTGSWRPSKVRKGSVCHSHSHYESGRARLKAQCIHLPSLCWPPNLLLPVSLSKDLMVRATDRCDECGEGEVAVHCHKCDVSLCSPCYQSTHSSRLFRTHPVVAVAQGRRPRPEPLCALHPGESVRFIRRGSGEYLCRYHHTHPLALEC